MKLYARILNVIYKQIKNDPFQEKSSLILTQKKEKILNNARLSVLTMSLDEKFLKCHDGSILYLW